MTTLASPPPGAQHQAWSEGERHRQPTQSYRTDEDSSCPPSAFKLSLGTRRLVIYQSVSRCLVSLETFTFVG